MAGVLVLSVLFGLLAVLIIGANILLIVIFSRRKLRKRSNFLLLGLAVVDLMVGTVSVPLFIAQNTIQAVSKGFIVASDIGDIMIMLASIFTLAVISLERMYAVCWPFRYRTLRKRAYILAVGLPWIPTFLVTFIWFFTVAWPVQIILVDRVYKSFLSFSLVLPLIIICTAYCVIWKKEHISLQHQSAQQDAQERKLAKTLLIIIGAFAVTWVPTQIMFIVYTVCEVSSSSCQISPSRSLVPVWDTVLFLRFSNPFLNFIVYSFRMPDFREHLRKMVKLSRNSWTRRQEVVSFATRLAESRETAV